VNHLYKSIIIFILSILMYELSSFFFIVEYNVYYIFLVHSLIITLINYSGLKYVPSILISFIIYYDPYFLINDKFSFFCLLSSLFISFVSSIVFKHLNKININNNELNYMIVYVVALPIVYNLFYYLLSHIWVIDLNIFSMDGALISLYFSDVLNSLSITPIFFIISEYYLNNNKIKLSTPKLEVFYYIPFTLVFILYLLYPSEQYKELILFLFVPSIGFIIGFKGRLEPWLICAIVSIGIYIGKCEQLNNGIISIYEFNSSLLFLVVINFFLFLLLIKGTFYNSLLKNKNKILSRDPVTLINNINCLLDDCKNKNNLILIEINFQDFFSSYIGLKFKDKISIYNKVKVVLENYYLVNSYLSPNSSGLILSFSEDIDNVHNKTLLNKINDIVSNIEVTVSNNILNIDNINIKGMKINLLSNSSLVDSISKLCDSTSINNTPLWIESDIIDCKIEETIYSKSLISDDYISIHFQQYQSNFSDHLYGEILTRVVHKDKIESIYKYFPMMSKFSLFMKLDFIVLEKTFSLINTNNLDLSKVGYISLNISTQSLSSDVFLDKIDLLFTEFSVIPEKYCFEISESEISLDSNIYMSNIIGLKKRGVKIAIDDLGSGCSGFNYLKNLPYDIIKFDGEFIKNIERNESDYSIVKAINNFCLDMNKETVAEFVETEEQCKLLKELGITYFQGFFVAKPVPFQSFLNKYELNN